MVLSEKEVDKSTLKKLFARAEPKKVTHKGGLSAQGFQMNAGTAVDPIMRNIISQDSLIIDSLRQLEISPDPESAFDWDHALQEVDDQSDMNFDRYYVTVIVPLKSDHKVLYRYDWYAEGYANYTGYYSSTKKRAVGRVDGDPNSITRISYWDLDHADVSTFVYSKTAPQLFESATIVPLNTGHYLIGQDVAIPTSERPAKYSGVAPA